ncbi:MAG TPA: DUF2752 domain-containing protein [Burkholderiaceae bacterium]
MHKAGRCENKGWERLLFGLLTALALLAIAAPGIVLRIAPPCLFDLAGFEHCWGCGMTRAIVACLRTQFRLAWDTNPRVFIVLPLLAAEYLRLGWRVTGAGLAKPAAVKP